MHLHIFAPHADNKMLDKSADAYLEISGMDVSGAINTFEVTADKSNTFEGNVRNYTFRHYTLVWHVWCVPSWKLLNGTMRYEGYSMLENRRPRLHDFWLEEDSDSKCWLKVDCLLRNYAEQFYPCLLSIY